jgi:queuine tRNA-ribosyltransferase
LRTRLTQTDRADPLVVWDVGLGAAFNAMAAVRCFEQTYAQLGEHGCRSLHIVSFENDFDPLILATRNPDCFLHVRHAAPVSVLKHGRWKHTSQLLRWEVCRGSFREQFSDAPPPDLIFYDPFSLRADVALWTTEIFTRIFAHCESKAAELYTYSASTAVRAALLAAGFFVAEGVGTGPKSSTTIAFTNASGASAHPLAPRLFGREWLRRWRRSHAKFPPLLTTAEHARLEQVIETHRQFCGVL